MDATPIESYEELVRTLRARIVELGIICDTIDKVAGLAPRYAAKLLSEQPVRHFGAVSLFPVLASLGLRLRIEADDAAVARLRQRSDWYLMVRRGPRYRPSPAKRRRVLSSAKSPTAAST